MVSVPPTINPESIGPPEMPCCGLTALAVVSGMSFAAVWVEAGLVLDKRSTWRGRLTVSELERVMEALGLIVDEQSIRANLSSYAERTRDGSWRVVHLSKHFIALRDSYYVDQYTKTLTLVAGAVGRRKVKNAWCVIGQRKYWQKNSRMRFSFG